MPAVYVVKHRRQVHLVNKFFACTPDEIPREIQTHLGLRERPEEIICLPLSQRKLADGEIDRLYREN